MDGYNHSCKKSHPSLVTLREASAVKKMNDRSLLFCLNKITHYFKKWTTGSELNELNLNI